MIRILITLLLLVPLPAAAANIVLEGVAVEAASLQDGDLHVKLYTLAGSSIVLEDAGVTAINTDGAPQVIRARLISGGAGTTPPACDTTLFSMVLDGRPVLSVNCTEPVARIEGPVNVDAPVESSTFYLLSLPYPPGTTQYSFRGVRIIPAGRAAVLMR